MDEIIKFIQKVYYNKENIEVLKKIADKAVNIYYNQLKKITIKELYDFMIPLGLEYSIRLVTLFYFVHELDLVAYSFLIEDIIVFLNTLMPKESVDFYVNIIDRMYADISINKDGDNILDQTEYTIITIIEYAGEKLNS